MSVDNYVEEVVRPAFEQYIREAYSVYTRSGDHTYVESILGRTNDRGYLYDNTPVHFKWIGFRDAYLRLTNV